MKKQLFLRCAISGLVLISCLISNRLTAQYNAAIGLRVVGTTGIDGKFFTQKSKAVEVLGGWFGNGSSITVLIEKYSPIENTSGLYIYYGGGPHLSFYNGRSGYYGYFGREVTYHQNNNVAAGIDGIVGLEYRLPDGVPISFSLDLKPFVEVGTGGYIGAALDPSFGIKFIIH